MLASLLKEEYYRENRCKRLKTFFQHRTVSKKEKKKEAAGEMGNRKGGEVLFCSLPVSAV